MKAKFKSCRRRPGAWLAVLAALAAAPACGGGDDGGNGDGDAGGGGPADDLADAPAVIDAHVAIVRAGYADALATARSLQASIGAFVAAPSPATLSAARAAWLAAREPYGRTEVHRFYGGPIDAPETGPEGRINAWPLDEVYIDYVMGNPGGGIINDPAAFPEITKQLIAERNEQGGEENVSSGYHAIEFLLWGQDTSPSGPGARPHTDYLPGAAHHQRRGRYLRLAAELLVDDLGAVHDAWAEGAPYPADLRADPAEALRRILQGMASLSGAELAGERMTVALENRDQEDEHSCFSDNTHRDLRANAIAIEDAYLGRRGALDGPGLDDLVAARDPALDAKLKQRIAASVAAIELIPAPFDRAILDDAGREKVRLAVIALRDQTETIAEVAARFGLRINLE